MAVRVAAVDVGTDSTRLLIADVDGLELREVARRTVQTQMGIGLWRHGLLTPAAISRVVTTFEEYAAEIERHECEIRGAVLTSAVRDARNGAHLTAEIRGRFRIDARVIDGQEEAELTFRGVTLGRELDGPTLVVDVGAGSTDFVVGAGSAVLASASTDLGVARKTARFLTCDPPRAEEVHALAQHVRRTVERALPARLRAQIEAGLVTAEVASWQGATSALGDEAERSLGRGVMTLELADLAVERLQSVPLELVRQVPGLQSGRAASLVAGAVLLAETMRATGLPEVELCERELVHGLALQLADRVAAP